MAPLPDYAGIRQYRRAKSTGTHVGVYNGAEASLDTAGGPWTLICEEHAGTLAVDTRSQARYFSTVPEEWCPGCLDGHGPECLGNADPSECTCQDRKDVARDRV